MDRPGNLDVTTTFTDTTVSGGNVHFGNHFGNIINYEGESGRSTRDHLRSEALKALYWTDPEVDLTKAEDRSRAGRTPRTCEWVLENEDFKMWQAAKSPQLLLITGEPGIGKTVLATFLVDYFKKQSASTGSDFAYFFCMNAEARQSTGLGILRGLLLLLLRKRPALCDHLLKDFPVKGENLFESIESLWPVFEAVITDDTLGNVLLQVDGLDECDGTSRDLLVSRLGGLMRKGGGSNIKVVITSRVIRTVNDLASHFQGATRKITMDVGKVNKDLQRFIEYEVDDIASKCGWDPVLKTEVTEQVKNQDGGTFAWASLALKTVSKKRPHQVIHELSNLPLGLQSLYARILHEIPPGERDMVYRVLVLVIGADEPMSLDELSIALYLYPDESWSRAASKILPTNKQMDEGKHWVQTCAVLLRMAEDFRGVVRVSLFHLTLKEFLTSKQLPPHVSSYHIEQEQANRTLLAISTAYLLSEELNAVAIDVDNLKDMALKKFKYRKLFLDEKALALKKTFRHLKDEILRGRKGRLREKEEERRKEEAQEQQEVHRQFELCKAWSEVEDRHLVLLESAYQIQRKWNPSAAIKRIPIMIFDPRLKYHSRYNKHDFLFVLRLMIDDSLSAATRPIRVMWRFMVASDSTYPWEFRDIHDCQLHKSIAMAARSGRSDMLEAFVRLNPLGSLSRLRSVDPYGCLRPRITLAMAMQTFVPKGKPPVQRDQGAFDLLFSAARLDCIPDKSSLLHAAAEICCSYLVKRCIESGDQVFARDILDKNPLHSLEIGFDEAVLLCARNKSTDEAILSAQLILDADPESTILRLGDKDGRIPLHYAAETRCLKLQQLLIDANTDCTLFIAQDRSGQVPLHLAVDKYHHLSLPTNCSASHSVAALLQGDHEKKSLHIADHEGKLPTHYATERRCLICTKLLVEADVTRSTLLVRDRDGRTPLDRAQEEHKLNQEKRPGLAEHSLEVVKYLSKATTEAQKLQEDGWSVVD